MNSTKYSLFKFWCGLSCLYNVMVVLFLLTQRTGVENYFPLALHKRSTDVVYTYCAILTVLSLDSLFSFFLIKLRLLAVHAAVTHVFAAIFCVVTSHVIPYEYRTATYNLHCTILYISTTMHCTRAWLLYHEAPSSAIESISLKRPERQTSLGATAEYALGRTVSHQAQSI